MSFLKNIGVGLQITSISMIALVGFVIIGLFYYSGASQQDEIQLEQSHATEAAMLSSELQYDLTNAKSYENAFLLNHRMKDVEAHKAILAEATPQIDTLKKFHDEEAMLNLLDEVKTDFQMYAKQFYEVVDDIVVIGLTQQDGLRAEMNAAVTAVEEILEANDAVELDEILAQMRRSEKDFVITEKPEFVAEMNTIMDAFDARLAVTTAIPDGMKETVEKGFDLYFEKFNRIATLTLEVNADKKVMNAMYDEVIPQLDQLIADSEKDLADATAMMHEVADVVFMKIIIAIVVTVAVVLGLSALIGRGITSPIGNMTSAMGVLADGDLEVDIPAQDYGNEMGKMAAAVQVFKENAIEVKRLEAEQKAAEERQAQERRKMMLKMADDFDNQVGHVVNTVTSAATELEASASTLSSTAEETSSQATTVAAASEQASANVQTVASAAEELVSSENEIGRHVQRSSSIADSAAEQARSTQSTVETMVGSVEKIGAVVAMITDIAEQTNLLALNATIEAARAGDAGKGFAVVASEVKNLANQTAKATEEISSQINQVQDVTHQAAEAIDGISKIILEMDEIANSIAAAVEEQTAATGEIARNVDQASQGTQEVSANIAGVTQASQETSASAQQILNAAQQLSKEGELLRNTVNTFLDSIRNG